MPVFRKNMLKIKDLERVHVSARTERALARRIEIDLEDPEAMTRKQRRSLLIGACVATVSVATALVRPAVALWDTMLAAVLAIFDRLGPGDWTGLLSGQKRYPETTDRYPPTLYRSAVEAAVMGVPGYAVNGELAVGVTGVQSATATLPGSVASITPSPK